MYTTAHYLLNSTWFVFACYLVGCFNTQHTPLDIDREFVTSAKKFANFNEFSEIKKIRKNSYKNSLNARVSVAFQIWKVTVTQQDEQVSI